MSSQSSPNQGILNAIISKAEFLFFLFFNISLCNSFNPNIFKFIFEPTIFSINFIFFSITLNVGLLFVAIVIVFKIFPE